MYYNVSESKDVRHCIKTRLKFQNKLHDIGFLNARNISNAISQ